MEDVTGGGGGVGGFLSILSMGQIEIVPNLWFGMYGFLPQ